MGTLHAVEGRFSFGEFELWHVYLSDCYLSQTINNRVSGILYRLFYMTLQHGSQHVYQLT